LATVCVPPLADAVAVLPVPRVFEDDAVLVEALDPVLPVEAMVDSPETVPFTAGITSLVPIFMRVGSTVGLALAINCHLLVEPSCDLAMVCIVSPFWTR